MARDDLAFSLLLAVKQIETAELILRDDLGLEDDVENLLLRAATIAIERVVESEFTHNERVRAQARADQVFDKIPEIDTE